MPNQIIKEYKISVSELDNLIKLGEKLAIAVKKAKDFTKNQRNQIRVSIAETCELIDSMLTLIKQRISNIIRDIRLGNVDNDKIKYNLTQLSDMNEWENQYRNFQLCEPLRSISRELFDTIHGRLGSFFSNKDKKELQDTIGMYFKSEGAVGISISEILSDLSDLDRELESNPDFVLDTLEEAKKQVQEYRNKFINLEIKMHKYI